MSERPMGGLMAELEMAAACRFDPELHTGPDVFEMEPSAARAARVDAAKQVCEECPVWSACLEYALRIRPTEGVWAGYTVPELARLQKAVRQALVIEAA